MTRCTRCGREIKHPIYVNGFPYGPVCAEIARKKNLNYRGVRLED